LIVAGLLAGALAIQCLFMLRAYADEVVEVRDRVPTLMANGQPRDLLHPVYVPSATPEPRLLAVVDLVTGSAPDAAVPSPTGNDTTMPSIPPQVEPYVPDVVAAPDPLEHPSAAWQFLLALYKLGIWPLGAAVLLMVSRSVVRRMQPGPNDKPLTGLRLKTLAIASALFAVAGPLLELLLHTGGAAALAAGVIYGFGLLKDAFDPPKGSAAIRV
jgi:hypothetical protein